MRYEAVVTVKLTDTRTGREIERQEIITHIGDPVGKQSLTSNALRRAADVWDGVRRWVR
jgi:hypothetical protein